MQLEPDGIHIDDRGQPVPGFFDYLIRVPRPLRDAARGLLALAQPGPPAQLPPAQQPPAQQPPAQQPPAQQPPAQQPPAQQPPPQPAAWPHLVPSLFKYAMLIAATAVLITFAFSQMHHGPGYTQCGILNLDAAHPACI